MRALCLLGILAMVALAEAAAGRLDRAADGPGPPSDCSARHQKTPLRILIFHEQHLQPMGCDVRLLGIIRGLLAGGVEVSLFFRSHTPVAKRSPPSEKLATLLRIPRGYREEWLRRDVRQLPPPAIYENAGTAQLARLFAQGWYHAVLVFFWFWNDPRPNIGELVLPALHTFSPRGRRPFVAILSDDAHALRDARLGSWEAHAGLRANYTLRATQHAHREATAYAFADLLLHITQADSSAERAAFPFARRFGLLRLALDRDASNDGGSASGHSSGSGSDSDSSRATNSSSGGGDGSIARRRLVPTSDLDLAPQPRVGFLGNGWTPTNHLAVQWFLANCWAPLRARHPALRLRLIGMKPAHRMGADGRERACSPSRELHCGWAWGTPYAGSEREHGIDELGFVDDAELDAELASWSLMAVPVLQTTGVNTKVFEALRLGIPLVITSTALAPFEVAANSSAALVADDSAAFVAAVDVLLTSGAARARLAAGGRAHWERLVKANHAAEDLRHLIRTLCKETSREGFMGSSRLSPVPLAFGVDEESATSHDGGMMEEGGALGTAAAAEGAKRAAEGGSAAAAMGSAGRGGAVHASATEPAQAANASGSGGSEARVQLRCFGGAGTMGGDAQHGTMGGDADGGGGPASSGLLPVLIGVHATSAANATFAKRLVSGAWRTVCHACGLRCAFPQPARHAADALPAAAVLPPRTQLAVLSLGAQQVPDLEGISLEPSQPASPLLAARHSYLASTDGNAGAGGGTVGGAAGAAVGLAGGAGVGGARAGAGATAIPIVGVGRFVHFVVDLSHELGNALSIDSDGANLTLRSPALPDGDAPAAENASPPSYPLVDHLGIAGTRLLLRATRDGPRREGPKAAADAPETVLGLAALTEVCQERAAWRTAFRFVGIHSAALPELWRRLSHDWPALFHCGREGGAGHAAADAPAASSWRLRGNSTSSI